MFDYLEGRGTGMRNCKRGCAFDLGWDGGCGCEFLGERTIDDCFVPNGYLVVWDEVEE